MVATFIYTPYRKISAGLCLEKTQKTMIEFQCNSWLTLYSGSKTSNYLQGGLKSALQFSFETVNAR